MNTYPEEEIHRMRSNFDVYDFNRDGRIAAVEVVPCLRSLRFIINNKDAEKIFMEVEQNLGGFVEYEQFIEIVKNNKLQSLSLDKHIDAFKAFDTNLDQQIDISEFRTICTKIGDKLKQSEIDDFINKLDLNEHSRVSVQDLCKKMYED